MIHKIAYGVAAPGHWQSWTIFANIPIIWTWCRRTCYDNGFSISIWNLEKKMLLKELSEGTSNISGTDGAFLDSATTINQTVSVQEGFHTITWLMNWFDWDIICAITRSQPRSVISMGSAQNGWIINDCCSYMRDLHLPRLDHWHGNCTFIFHREMLRFFFRPCFNGKSAAEAPFTQHPTSQNPTQHSHFSIISPLYNSSVLNCFKGALTGSRSVL